MSTPDGPDLSVCGICGQEAQFTDNAPGANPVSYCSTDLPPHLRPAAELGQLPLLGDDTKAQLLEEAKDFDIEGRTTMTKAQLQTAVAAARATRLQAERQPIVLPGTNIEVPARPEPVVDPEPLTVAGDAAERTDSGEPGTMTDAPALEAVEVHDHSVESAGDVEEQQPKKSTRGGKRR